MLEEALTLAANYPEIFTIQYPPGKQYFQKRYRAPISTNVLEGLEQVLLYLHIPFCEAKCFYCNFAVDIRKDQELYARYVKALIDQLSHLENILPSDCKIPGIDIGGGTPTLISTELLELLLQELEPWRERSTVPWSMSIETTPQVAALEPDKLKVLVDGGVNRISMGIQSTNKEVLTKVNRKSVLETQAIENLLCSGFRRVNIDLVFGLPGQTVKLWEEDVRRIASTGVDSITTYDCLYRGKGRMLPEYQPSPEEYRKFYDIAYEILSVNGYYAPYGSVNFSKHSGETGTSPYFEGRLLDGLPYIGLGNYASSLIGNTWWFAPYRVDDWMKIAEREVLPVQDSYELPDRELMAKYVLLSLNFGLIDPARFRRIFRQEFGRVFHDTIEYLVDNVWMEQINGSYYISPGGFSRMWAIRALFYPDSAIEWLQEIIAKSDSEHSAKKQIRNL